MLFELEMLFLGQLLLRPLLTFTAVEGPLVCRGTFGFVLLLWKQFMSSPTDKSELI